MGKVIRIIFLLIVFSSFSAEANVVLDSLKQGQQLGKEIEYLAPEEEISFEEVLKSQKFTQNDTDVPNFGIKQNSVWIKFSVVNNQENPDYLLQIAYPILDEIDLYVQAEGGYEKISSGESKVFGSRKYKNPNFIFDLDLPKGKEKTFFIRIKSAEQLIVPITISRSENVWWRLSQEELMSGMYLGAVLIMFLYNLFIFISVKDRSYLYYVIYVGFVGLTQIGIKGHNYQYLWPNSPDFQSKSLIYFACLSGVAALLFTKKFLQTRTNAPRWDRVLSALILLLGIAFIITLFGEEQIGFQLMQMATSLFAISILIVSFILRKGSSPAKFVFGSWSVLLIGAIVFALKDNGILPYNNLTAYSMQVASIIEMALLSFGLADRINILTREKEISQAAALAAAEENERIIREQNVVLEQKVQERTHELLETNEELHATLENLKQTQTQLVAAEKMASLGQLTAGIAHEINNPINFVTSNVSPLQRDVNSLIEAIEVIENVALTDKSSAEKQQEIEDYKEELDYDYLKIEISHLLKGIQEGASRTAEIVKGLRIFSRVDEDDLKRADINEGIDSTLVIMNSALNGANIQVIKNFGELPLVECYPGKLNQVFLNIISNAIHAISSVHNDSGNGQLTIITERKSEDKIVIIFEDNGVGMSETTKAKIFDPFFTTKDVGEGTGLGMSIAFNTIKKHNGEIHVLTELNKGTQFTIELPIYHQIATS